MVPEIAVFQSYLGSDIIRRATKRVRCLVEINLQFTHAEIGDTNVTVTIEQDVIQFQVSVKYARI